MSAYDWGYKAAAKEMQGFATGGKVAVRSHTRMPRVTGKPNIKESITKSVKVAAPAPAMPKAMIGAATGLRKGGQPHSDAKQDAKQIKGMVKSDCLKPGGKGYKTGGPVNEHGVGDKQPGVNTAHAAKEVDVFKKGGKAVRKK